MPDLLVHLDRYYVSIEVLLTYVVRYIRPQLPLILINQFHTYIKCSNIKEAIGRKANCQIHAEVKVLGYLQGHGLVGKAINSVGINKLCCPACIEYINAMDIAIHVGGTHNKWYSWHFSLHNQFLPLDQLKRMKQRVLAFFNSDWSTHLSDQRQRSHSIGNQSDSSRGDAEPDIELGTEYDYYKFINDEELSN